jgi:hypothetical protein
MKCLIAIIERSGHSTWLALLATLFDQLDMADRATAVCLLELSLQHSAKLAHAIVELVIRMLDHTRKPLHSPAEGASEPAIDGDVPLVFTLLLLLLLARDACAHQQVRSKHPKVPFDATDPSGIGLDLHIRCISRQWSAGIIINNNSSVYRATITTVDRASWSRNSHRSVDCLGHPYARGIFQ